MGRVFNWDDLRILMAGAASGSLAGAARDLGIKHTTVGRRLDDLEQALGARLFLRDRKGLTLTEAGRQVLVQARGMERFAVEIEQTAAQPANAMQGTVRVTTSESFTGFLVRRLQPLRARYDELIVEVLTTNAAVDLLSRKADFAIRFMVTTEPGLMQRRLCDCGWALYASPGYLEKKGRPRHDTDLAGHDVIGFDEPLTYVPGAAWLDKHAGEARIVMRANSIFAVMNAVSMGIGIGAIPCFLALEVPNIERLSDGLVGTRVAWLVAHPDVARIPRVRTVIDFVIDMMKQNEALITGLPTPTAPVA